METKRSVRVRFAPSPTGYLHIGSLRTALFNWLFARHHGGSFLIRVEDTDTERSTQEYTKAIFDSLSWVGLESDEPVVIQSERVSQHTALIDTLVQEGKAYRCYCTQDELVTRCGAGGENFFIRYDRHCLNRQDLPPEGTPFVVRFKIPDDRPQITFDDLVYGSVSFDAEQLDDFIIARSDGSPIYNLVVVADDHAMGITQVIRGEDHISNTPKQILLYEACGFSVPQFAHLPMILGPSGDRLSKRDGATSTYEYRQDGYLADGLLNYLARLGWSHGDQEIFTRQELVDYFSLDHVGKKGAIFDPQKLAWVNGQHIRQTSDGQLLTLIARDVDPEIEQKLQGWSPERIAEAIALYKERVTTLVELADELTLLHDGPTGDQETQWATEQAIGCLQSVQQQLTVVEPWDGQTVAAVIKQAAKDVGMKFAQLAHPVRQALIGKGDGPGLSGLIMLVGRDVTVQRIETLLEAVAHGLHTGGPKGA